MELPGWPHQGSPFHAGERFAQERAGKREQMEGAGRRVVRAEMPEQHRTFFAQLPFMLMGALDHAGIPWATVMTGSPGFAHAPDPRRLRIDAQLDPDDPLSGALEVGADIGLLGIELHTRRRNRMNGTISALDAGGMTVDVRQSFGNCPRYIQLRDLEPVASGPHTERPVWDTDDTDRLDEPGRAMLAGADTIFIATHYQDGSQPHSGGADVSHRGGKPGFVRVDEDGRTLTFPDFNGNAYFNTIGNLVSNPRAGLLVIDFASGTLLHVAARAEIIWEGPEVAVYQGAERLVRLHVERVVRRPGAMPLRGKFVAMSPVLERTGDWSGITVRKPA
jgi:predicted pyridoxine 5'-phosphate oxidase superfamily flavin-nucleotide-binding protein